MFYPPSHMVSSILFSMLRSVDIIFLLVKILHKSKSFDKGGSWSCHGEQNAGYPVKEHKKLDQKPVSKITLHFVWGHLSRKQTMIYLR